MLYFIAMISINRMMTKSELNIICNHNFITLLYNGVLSFNHKHYLNRKMSIVFQNLNKDRRLSGALMRNETVISELLNKNVLETTSCTRTTELS